MKLTLAQIEEHINDQITRIMMEKGTGRLTEKQFAKECFDLARWTADRIKVLPIEQQKQFAQSRLAEALKRNE